MLVVVGLLRREESCQLPRCCVEDPIVISFTSVLRVPVPEGKSPSESRPGKCISPAANRDVWNNSTSEGDDCPVGNWRGRRSPTGMFDTSNTNLSMCSTGFWVKLHTGTLSSSSKEDMTEVEGGKRGKMAPTANFQRGVTSRIFKLCTCVYDKDSSELDTEFESSVLIGR